VKRRRLVVLRYAVGLPEAEVAAMLGISIGAVKSGTARGLAQLRLELESATVPDRSGDHRDGEHHGQ
jgi:DNA-directed RNA polymerase specialized sigma24 family protein